MKKILWFSRHAMTLDQEKALGDDIEIMQVSKTIQHATEVIDEINECDVIAIVAPIGLQMEFLKLAGNKPVIMAISEREIIKSESGEEDKIVFKFVKWERLIRIEVEKEDYIPE